jgi:UDP-GlcNAc3NAcA epimerase
MQMPEEINRIVTDRLSTLLFCPTQASLNNLMNEGFQNFNCQYKIVGDIMLDALRLFSTSSKKVHPSHTPFALCTLHRAENIDNVERFKILCDTLNTISKEIRIIFPIHPRTK